MDLVSGFPKFFTKKTVKVMPDKVNPSFGEVSRFKLPASAMIDFRTISIFADVSLFRYSLIPRVLIAFCRNLATYCLLLMKN